jgi:hypothetical protein
MSRSTADEAAARPGLALALSLPMKELGLFWKI